MMTGTMGFLSFGLFCFHLFHMGAMLGMFHMALGRQEPFGRHLRFLYPFFMAAFELAVDTLIYRLRLPWCLGIVHYVLFLFPLLWKGRKRLLDSLFSLFLLLHVLTVCSYLCVWLFCDFTPHYGLPPTIFCIFVMEAVLGGLFLLYFKRVIVPMLRMESSGAGMEKLWWWSIPASFYAVSVYNCCIQDILESPIVFTVVYMAINMGLDLFFCWILKNSMKEREQISRMEQELQLFSVMRKQYEGVLEKLEQTGQMRHDMRISSSVSTVFCRIRIWKGCGIICWNTALPCPRAA